LAKVAAHVKIVAAVVVVVVYFLRLLFKTGGLL